MIVNEDIIELHARRHSLYDSQKEQEEALRELHEQNYMIFDEFETELLKDEFREEFSKVAHDMSLVSMQEQAKTRSLFISKHKPKKKMQPEYPTLWGVQEKHEKALGEVVSALLNQHKEELENSQKTKKAQNNPYAVTFYIIKNGKPNRACNAHGFYDYKKKKFVIGAGSLLSLDVASAYASTTSNLQRLNFLYKYCVKRLNGYYVKVDAPCDSPSAAACFVTGRTANGWVEWKDKEGKTLKEIFLNH